MSAPHLQLRCVSSLSLTAFLNGAVVCHLCSPPSPLHRSIGDIRNEAQVHRSICHARAGRSWLEPRTPDRASLVSIFIAFSFTSRDGILTAARGPGPYKTHAGRIWGKEANEINNILRRSPRSEEAVVWRWQKKLQVVVEVEPRKKKKKIGGEEEKTETRGGGGEGEKTETRELGRHSNGGGRRRQMEEEDDGMYTALWPVHGGID
uniref:Uncharacterized protein n=1 Tax=Brassica campestris TaxID=3711 RepID=M4DDT7_BRACM